MKKALLSLAAMLCMTLGMAQNPGAQGGPQGGPQGQRPQRLTVDQVNTKMQDELKLDEAQMKEVAKLNKKYSSLYEGMAMSGGGGFGGGRPMGGGAPMGGGGGGDFIDGGSGKDYIDGGDGDDTLIGGTVDIEDLDNTQFNYKELHGGAGNDIIYSTEETKAYIFIESS